MQKDFLDFTKKISSDSWISHKVQSKKVKSLLYIALDQEYLTEEIFRELETLIDDTKKKTLGLLRHVKSTIDEKPNKVREPKAEYKTKLSDEFLDLPDEFIHSKKHEP